MIYFLNQHEFDWAIKAPLVVFLNDSCFWQYGTQYQGARAHCSVDVHWSQKQLIDRQHKLFQFNPLKGSLYNGPCSVQSNTSLERLVTFDATVNVWTSHCFYSETFCTNTVFTTYVLNVSQLLPVSVNESIFWKGVPLAGQHPLKLQSAKFKLEYYKSLTSIKSQV
jgi:hypothetical protein